MNQILDNLRSWYFIKQIDQTIRDSSIYEDN